MTWPEALRARSLVFVGYRGVGKTEVGRRIAARLDAEFIDTDDSVERQSGTTIAEIFARHGEPRFRELEAVAVRDALAANQRVVSVGGGAILRAESRDLLRDRAYCIWLTAPAEEIVRRLRSDPRTADARPPLSSLGVEDEVAEFLARRLDLYGSVANATVETASRTIDRVCDYVMAVIGG